ncbi:MAG: hypothetical protein E6Q97_29920 [Desulfurellales bacterium]|nr:MAG: hypothetical protein E6Q97_29920 [Desulfurellales bacterium]
MKRRDQIEPLESGLYVCISHPEQPLLLRGCRMLSAYRAGFEDCLYARVYANPFPVASPAWFRYDAGNEDARRSLQQQRLEYSAEVIA